MSERVTVDVPALAREVAAALADGWEVKPADGDTVAYASLRRASDGAEFYMHHDSYRGRLTIGPSWPRDPRTRDTFEPYVYAPNARGGSDRIRVESIGVGPSRPPAAIAREIARRFLPAYLPQYAEAVRLQQASETANTGAAALVRELAAILSEPARDTHDGRGFRIYRDGATFEVSRHGSVKIEVNSDADLARAIARLLAARKVEA